MFILFIIYLTVLFVVFCFYISVSKKNRVKGFSHGRKLRLKTLTLAQPGEQNRRFWDKVNASGLTPPPE
jgi:hypothetical protein